MNNVAYFPLVIAEISFYNDTAMATGSIKYGTMTWNYDSWVGLVYSIERGRAAEYLPEYAEKFDTAEIDSWFYRIPSRNSVEEYRDAVPADFSFTCKVPREITLTHNRPRKKSESPTLNPTFLSPDRFDDFLDAVEPLLPKLDAIMFEFEYLNKKKMPSQQEFLGLLDRFFDRIPQGLPYAVETRNRNYINDRHFEFLARRGLAHVFSEKEFMPHIYDVHRRFGDYIGDRTVIRLLGGDRGEIEKATGKVWNRIVMPKDDKTRIATMAYELARSKLVILNVNNHYEGCAPLTIEALRGMITQ